MNYTFCVKKSFNVDKCVATICNYFCNYAEALLKRVDYFENYVIISLGKVEVT